MTYLIIAGGAFLISFILTPLVQRLCVRFQFLDMPDQRLKNHTRPIPRLGGVAIFLGALSAILATRFLTHYPTGTIRQFRYILLAMSLMFTLGLIDDLYRDIIRYRGKFFIQLAVACILLLVPIRIHFLTPAYLATIITVLWVVGITNSINLIDIMDGLAATQVAIAAAAFLAIGFPSEDIYVNIFAAAILGSTLGFMPYNLTTKFKIFMGDSGSLTLGLALATLAIGSSYTTHNPYAVFAPILILGVPMFETFFLIYIRSRQGLSPFMGSHDHVAHRLQSLGFTSKQIVLTMGSIALLLSLLAMLIASIENPTTVLMLYLTLIGVLLFIGKFLGRLKVIA